MRGCGWSLALLIERRSPAKLNLSFAHLLGEQL